MALATYADLIAAVPAWLTKGDTTTSLIESWIALAEARVGRELRVRRMLTRTTSTVATEYSTVPTDFVAGRSIRQTASPYQMLEFLTPEQAADFKQTQPSGTTKAWSLIGTEFWFIPTAPGAVEMVYYAKVPALTSSATTNWLLTNHPDIYLRGTLLEAALYYEDEEAMSRWQGLFSQSLDAARKADLQDAYGANLRPTLYNQAYA